MSEFIIPFAFQFDPTDEELIRGYLLPKVTGITLPLAWDGILEKKLYGQNAAPWDVFSDIHDSSRYWTTKKEGGATKKTIYALTRVSKVSKLKRDEESKRISRMAGCGTWSGQTGFTDIYHSDTGAIVGRRRMLKFDHSIQNIPELGNWIMYEYSLSGVAFIPSDLVLCKIIKSIKPSTSSSVVVGGESSKKRVQQHHKKPK